MKITNILFTMSTALMTHAALAAKLEPVHLTHDHRPSHQQVDAIDIRKVDPFARDNNYSDLINVSLAKGLIQRNSFTERFETAEVNCITTASLAQNSGDARHDLIKAEVNYSCFEDNIWSTTANDMQALFNESAMIAVANEARLLASNYDGSTANNLRYFVAYLRAGKWTQEQTGNSAIIGQHGAGLNDAIVSFLNALIVNANYYNTDETHAYLAKEAVILMYSTNNSDRYLYLQPAINLLDNYDKSWGSNAQNWFTKTLIYIYRAKDDSAFIQAVESNQALLDAFDRFLKTNTDLIGHSQEAQFNDVASEFGRMLKYNGQTKTKAQTLIKDFFARHTMTGNASRAWFKLIGQVNYFDGNNCNFYDTCNYKSELEAAILPITHSCSNSLVVRAQALTNEQLAGVCEELSIQESYFHQKLETNYTPVSNDNNSALELVIYDNTDQYKRFSYHIFGNSVDNGGIYLEGDPSVPGNVARFFAHEASWLLPEFKVWNLAHEYVHYLDGRFNTYGKFSDLNAHDTVWWGEGLAEYISKKDFNDGAIEEARKGTYSLSELLRTSYDNDATQIYDWSYLAVRYMFERQRNYIDNILIELRSGNFSAYNNILNSIGNTLDNEFSVWLQTVKSEQGTTEPDNNVLDNGQTILINSDGSETPTYTFQIPENAENLVIQSSGGTGDVDLYVKAGSPVSLSDYDHRPYRPGNSETINVAFPSQGTWHVMGNPYGNRAFENVNLSVNWDINTGGNNGSNVCDTQPAISRGNLENSQSVCLDSVTTYMGIYVATGQSTLTITTQGGDGDASVYQSSAGWPSTSFYENKATTANNNEESVVIINPRSGWHYIMVSGQGGGTQLTASFN